VAAIFARLDDDEDGAVTLEEFGSRLRHHGRRPRPQRRPRPHRPHRPHRPRDGGEDGG
jgi:hypothetical protein